MRFHMFLGILVSRLLALLSSFSVDPAAGIDHRQGNFKVGLQSAFTPLPICLFRWPVKGRGGEIVLWSSARTELCLRLGLQSGAGRAGEQEATDPGVQAPWSGRDGRLPGREAAHPVRHVPILAEELTSLCLFPPGGGMMVRRNHTGRPRCTRARSSWREPAGGWAGQLRKAEGWDAGREALGQLVQYSGMRQGPGWAMAGLGRWETLQRECEGVCVGCGFQGLGGSSDNHDRPHPPQT